MPKNTNPKTLITLNDLSAHFSQAVDGRVHISPEGAQFVISNTPAPVPMTGADVASAVKSDPNAVELKSMSGATLGFIIP